MPASAQEILENICVHLHVMTSALSCNGRVCVCVPKILTEIFSGVF